MAKNKKAPIQYLFLKAAIPACIIMGIMIFFVHFVQISAEKKLLLAQEQNNIKIGKKIISQSFQSILSDLRYITSSGYLKYFITDQSDSTRNNLEQEFLTIVNTKKIYDQIRYLDPKGMELIRVNKNQEHPTIVAKDLLQNKRDRYYFQDTMTIPCKEIFISPLDLNIEHKQIERPLKPMIRFGMPVCNAQGHKKGIVLSNYLGSNLLDYVRKSLAKEKSQLMLLNDEGYWLLSPKPKDEWGFMFKNDLRFQNSFSEAWKNIQTEAKGQFFTSKGLFTYQIIYPAHEGALANKTPLPVAPGLPALETENYHWILLLHLPQAEIHTILKKHLYWGLLQLGFTCLIIFPLLWLLTKERIRVINARKRMKQANEFSKAIATQIGEGLIVLDFHGNFLMINRMAEKLLGWQEAELFHKHIGLLIPEFKESEKESLLSSTIKANACRRIEPFYIPQKDGQIIPVSLTISPMYNQGTVTGAIIIFQDIAERLLAEEQLKLAASHDSMTGAKNRAELERLMDLEIEQSARKKTACTFLMIDIDYFKKINDSYGHLVGDQVLKEMSHYIRSTLRKSDIFGRYGGEEFVIILPQEDLQHSRKIAERLRLGIKENSLQNNTLKKAMTVSIGLASYPEHGRTSKDILLQADEALYIAKKQGRDRIVTAPENQ
ncbi:sensor domain-containing diguanylate cyclase [Desulfotalea psychrophila]|uniref:diguanylate cyclase n=1 Tax=Desulfotalea psychrophila (strain LSv54 / DSM 12343) TaxID=177439 RepID=Q6AKT7_DESPS|nr:diguanylate cyclase [Desulfotalea psychrophila]CAG37038.1 hypothetical protein DP2309 [Desulfotalea psychrophila LSv54]